MNKNVRKRCWSSCYCVSSCHFNIINSPWYPFSVISAPSVVREIRFPIRYPWYPSPWYPLYPLSVVSESVISALSVVRGIRLRVRDIRHPYYTHLLSNSNFASNISMIISKIRLLLLFSHYRSFCQIEGALYKHFE